jgi:hypothetical protein
MFVGPLVLIWLHITQLAPRILRWLLDCGQICAPLCITRPLRSSPVYMIVLLFEVGRDSSVGIVTRYGLDGPGIEFIWRRDFPHHSRPALGPTQPPIQWVPGLSWG